MYLKNNSDIYTVSPFLGLKLQYVKKLLLIACNRYDGLDNTAIFDKLDKTKLVGNLNEIVNSSTRYVMLDIVIFHVTAFNKYCLKCNTCSIVRSKS